MDRPTWLVMLAISSGGHSKHRPQSSAESRTGCGQVAHAAIAKAAPVRGELALGWLTHYAVGVAFAGVLLSLLGAAWVHSPTLWPALAVGMGTVAAPLLVMQPAMGSGFAASRTPTPLKNCLRSLANHTVFGLGLYLSALVIALISR